jgi:hypothetical protein
MKGALQKAFEEVSKLPETEQEVLGQWLLDEIKSEQRWGELFARSSDALSKLAREALAEHRAGRTQDLDPETL